MEAILSKNHNVSAMGLLVFALVLLLLLLAATVDAQNGDLLIPACKTVSGSVDFTFCKEALGSVGAGVDARIYQDLAVVASGLLAANAIRTAAQIDDLLREGGGPGENNDVTRQCLRSCRALYDGVVRGQPGCAAAIRGGRVDEARSSFSESASAVKECEDGFGMRKLASPLTMEDSNSINIAKLGFALLR